MLDYVIIARDSSSTPPGKPLTGLSPSWVFLRRLADGKDVAQPPIREIGWGQYRVSFDPEGNDDTSGQIDLGVSVASPADRFVDVVFFQSDSRGKFNLDARVSGVWSAPQRELTAPPPGRPARVVIG